MADSVDIPDPDGIAEILRLDVPEWRIEQDEALRALAERLMTTRNRRRIAEATYQFLASPREVFYEETAGHVRILEGGRFIEVRYVFTAERGQDAYRFLLRREEGGLVYLVEEKQKMVQEPWGGGTLPREVTERMLPAIRKHPIVWELSERIVRTVEPEEVNWDWQPAWNLENIGVPNRSGTLAEIVGKAPPRYVVLATWELSLEEHEWGASGYRVQAVVDPREDIVLGAWEDEWYALY